ncbi:MAG: class I SAM-dependent methyltransferase [Hyphomicrobium aestuarii]|nr:class I SAM-dependent methyltransferase [Hyphomicrobium aestuarii]
MLAKDDIRLAYRYILGRDPESDAVVDEHLRHVTDLASLRARCLSAPEFFKTNAREILRFFAVAEAQRRHGAVQYDCGPAELDALFAHIRNVWSRLGQVEPHFSVFSSPNFKPEHLDANLAAFYRSGVGETELLKSELSGLGLRSGGYRHVVELGSGVGRVTRYLADLGQQTTGFDISQPHLDLARIYIDREKILNVTLRHVAEPETVIFPSCDLFYSRIVLQHNPPPVQNFLIRRALAALQPGGVAVFQCPTYIQDYEFSVSTYLAGMHKIDNQELHALPQKAIFSAIAEAGCELLSVYRDNSIPRINQVSNRFVARKRDVEESSQ